MHPPFGYCPSYFVIHLTAQGVIRIEIDGYLREGELFALPSEQHLTFWTLANKRWLCLFIELLWLNVERGCLPNTRGNLLFGGLNLEAQSALLLTGQYLKERLWKPYSFQVYTFCSISLSMPKWLPSPVFLTSGFNLWKLCFIYFW